MRYGVNNFESLCTKEVITASIKAQTKHWLDDQKPHDETIPLNIVSYYITNFVRTMWVKKVSKAYIDRKPQLNTMLAKIKIPQTSL